MERPVVLSLVNDLFFSVRIETTLGGAGYRVIGAPDGRVAEIAGSERLALAIVDIGGFGLDWEAAIRALKSVDRELPILAFGSHKDLDARERALAAGADRVVAKSQFVDSLTELAGRYARLALDSDDAQ